MASAPPEKGRICPFALSLRFLAAHNLLRVAFFVMTQTGAVKPDHGLDAMVNRIVVYSELAIGLGGLAAVPGLVGSRSWGFWAHAGRKRLCDRLRRRLGRGRPASAAGGVIPPTVTHA